MNQLFFYIFLFFPFVYLNDVINICKRDTDNEQNKQEIPKCFEDFFKDGNIGEDNGAKFETEINSLKQIIKGL